MDCFNGLSSNAIGLKISTNNDFFNDIINLFELQSDTFCNIYFVLPKPTGAVKYSVFNTKGAYAFYNQKESDLSITIKEFKTLVQMFGYFYIIIFLTDTGIQVNNRFGFISHSIISLDDYFEKIKNAKSTLKLFLKNFLEPKPEFLFMNIPNSWEYSASK